MGLEAKNLNAEYQPDEESLPFAPDYASSSGNEIEASYEFIQKLLGEIATDDMHNEIIIPGSGRGNVEMVRVKTCLPVALKQNDAFLMWRAVTLTKHYKRSCIGNMTEATAKGALEYLATAGNDVGWRGHDGVPGHMYFLRKVLPVLSNMAKSPEDLERLCVDAIEILRELITSELAFTTHRTSPDLLKHFFDDVDRDDMRSWGRGGSASAGQFKYFYNYGKKPWEDDPKNQRQRKLASQEMENRKWLTMAIAKHQSWESDRHYDGGDYTNCTREIEEKFIPIYKDIPASCRANAMRAFVNYGGSLHSLAFFGCVQKVIKHFRENGGAKHLRHFFNMAQGAPELYSDSMSDDVRSQSFPIAEPEAVLAECKAISDVTEFRNELVDFAKFMVDGYQRRGKCVPTFISHEKDKEFDSRGRSLICLPKITEKFKSLKYPKKKIKEILAIPNMHTFLPKEVAIPLVSCYPEIDANFPGGIKALLKYLEEIKDSPDCMYFLVNSLKEPECKLPKKNLGKYLELAKTVVLRLGNAGAKYFQAGFLHEDSKFMKLAESNFDEFEKMINAAMDFASEIPDLPDLEQDRAYFFDAHVDDFSKPNFKKYLTFLTIIKDGIISYVASQGGKLSPRDEFRHSHVSQSIGLIKHSLRLISPSSPKKRDWFDGCGNPFPADIDYQALGKFVRYMIFSEKDPYQNGLTDYLNLIKDGLDYRVAAFVKFDQKSIIKVFDGEKTKTLKPPSLRNDPDIESPVPPERLTEIISLVADINYAIRDVCNICVSKNPEMHYINPDEERTKKLEPAAFKESSTALSKLHALRIKLEELEKDPELNPYVNFEHLKKRIDGAVNQAAFKRMLTISMDSPGCTINLKTDGLLRTTNSSTRMILTCTALLASLDIIRVPDNIRKQLKPIGLLPSGIGSHLMKVQTFDDLIRRHRDELVLNMKAVLPHFEKMVLDARLDIPEMFPIGGKVHTKNSMNDSGIRYLAETFGIDSTSFVLQHANTSLCLPPQLSSLEMKLFVRILEILGFIDSDMPDLQLTMCGRISEFMARRVGTAMLLGTDRGVVYEHGAFRSKSHDTQTGAHIMAYDASVLNTKLPTHPHEVHRGRTDIFGRHSFGDTDLYQVLGTLGTSLEFKTGFEDIARKFFDILHKILDKHNLVGTMNRSNWLYDSQVPGELGTHEEMVNALGNVWLQNAQVPNYGVIGEIQQLVNWALNEMRAASDGRKDENKDLIQRVSVF